MEREAVAGGVGGRKDGRPLVGGFHGAACRDWRAVAPGRSA